MIRASGTLYQIEASIHGALTQPLPGASAHCLLAPRPRLGWDPGQIPLDAKPSAALILLFPFSGEAYTLLTVRGDHLPQHAGQVSFPGGRLEPNESVETAALRESHEEVGLDPHRVRLIGKLSPLYIPASGFALFPVIGIADSRPKFLCETNEVNRILEISMSTLTGSEGLHLGYRWHKNNRYQVPYFAVDDERVWGATAMILSELLAVIGTSLKDPWLTDGFGPVATT